MTSDQFRSIPMKMSEVPDLRSLFEALLKRQDLNNAVEKVISVTEMDAVLPGFNFNSFVKRIIVAATLASTKVITRSLIWKELPHGPFTRAFVLSLRLFETELKCYSDVLPVFEDLLEKQKYPDEVIWPRCVDIMSRDTIILEDLQSQGFRMANKFEGLDLEHSTLVMQALGLFHSLSLSAKGHVEVSSEIFSKTYAFHTDFHVDTFTEALNFLIPLLKSWGDEWYLPADYIQALIPKLKDRFRDMFQLNETRLNVLNHGDCWTNNLMFKYNLFTSIPEKVRFVDFQQLHYNTPALDVVYFLATSPNVDVRRQHLDRLIRVYHQSLTTNMDRFLVEGRRPSFSEIRDEINRLGLFHFFLVLFLVPKIVLEAMGPFDLEGFLQMKSDGKQREGDSNTHDWLSYFKNPKFSPILEVALTQFMENGILK